MVRSDLKRGQVSQFSGPLYGEKVEKQQMAYIVRYDKGTYIYIHLEYTYQDANGFIVVLLYNYSSHLISYAWSQVPLDRSQ